MHNENVDIETGVKKSTEKMPFNYNGRIKRGSFLTLDLQFGDRYVHEFKICYKTSFKDAYKAHSRILAFILFPQKNSEVL